MDEVDLLLANQVDKNKTPAVQYLIFDQATVVHRFQAGLADIINQKPIDWSTTFNVYSVTKTFTALAILQLAEKGMLNIDNGAKQYLPDFPYSPEITVRQILTHTSGIPNPNPLSWIHLDDEHKDFDRDGFFDQIFKKHPLTKFLPNEKFAYSNLGYVLLGKIIEEVSGQKYEDYILDNIIRLLNIPPDELAFEITDKNKHAKGYQKKMSVINLALGFFMDKSKFMDKAEGKWKPFKHFHVNGTPYGGLIGSPNGFLIYLQELMKPNCILISDKYKEMLFSENFTNSNKATGMCLSWFRGSLNGNEYFSHAGGGGGYYCEIRIYPKLGWGSVIIFNRTGVTDDRFLDKLDKYFIPDNS
jgi:D-alanyl-D-alanine carboxypeptidase